MVGCRRRRTEKHIKEEASLPRMGLEADLAQFTGTLHYYRHPLGLLFTDGIKYLADHASSYWLIDLVASYQPTLHRSPFQLWHLAVQPDHSATMTMRDDDGLPPHVEQTIPYTDFPLSSFSCYCTQNVLMLRTEY